MSRLKPPTAEIAKQAENKYRDVNFRLANQFARFADVPRHRYASIDVYKVIEAATPSRTVTPLSQLSP
jgi:UDP-N-acetyl-D-mannosaminuronate dehydrogenase